MRWWRVSLLDIERRAGVRLWPLPLVAYLGLSYLVFDSAWSQVGPLTFAITAIGIAALLMVSAQLARLPFVARPLAIVGASTLYIYTTQHVTLFYLERVASFLHLGPEILTLPALVVIVVAGTAFGRRAMRTAETRWLFQAPWIGGAGAGGRAPAAV